MKRRSWWNSLRVRIVTWSFVPSTIILVIVALMTLYSYQQVAEDLVIGRNRELTRLSASQLASALADHTELLSSLARTSSMYEGQPAAQRAALVRARDRLVVFDGGVVVLNTRGIVTASEPIRLDLIGQDLSDRAYYRSVLRTPDPVFSNIVEDGPDGTEVIAAAVPIIDDEGGFQGTLVGMFRLGSTSVSAFYGSIVKLRIGETVGIYLVDGNGRLVYHSDISRIGVNVSGLPAVREVLGGRVGEQRSRDPNGREIISSYAPVPGTPWGLVAEEDWDILLSATRGYGQFLLILLALGVLVPAAVVIFGVRRITGPISDLIKASQEVADGNFGHTIEVPTGDELEDLATQFNRMSAQLQGSYANLEDRVAARTRELATLNTVAAAVSSSLDLSEVMDVALQKTMEAMNAPVGAAYRFDEKTELLTMVTYQGTDDEAARFFSRMTLAESWIGDPNWDRPQTRVIAELPETQAKQRLLSRGLQLLINVPLRFRGRLLGAIYLADTVQRQVTPEERALLASIGNQTALAVENARLYAQAERAAAAAERNRLARDLHDAVSQTLFSASLIAEVLPRLWERSPEEGRRRLEELRQLTRGALAEMRTLLLELRPTALTEADLGDLLRQLCEALTGRARVPVALSVEGEGDLPPDVQVAFYRIAQEALNNIAKHSGAAHAFVHLRHGPDGSVELSVRDDGQGFDAAGVGADHLGLRIMAERAEQAGATLSVNSKPGEGTQINVVWPAAGAGPSSPQTHAQKEAQ